MKREKIITFLTLLVLLHAYSAMGQISYGGKPQMNDADFSASKVLYLLPPEDPDYINALKSKARFQTSKPLEYATERTVDISPDFNGEWVYRDGKHIWRAHIISPGAYSIGVLFTQFRLENETTVFLYNPEGTHIKGGFTSKNNKDFGKFMVGHTPGEEIIVEVQTTNADRHYGDVRIGTVSHAFLPVFGKRSSEFTGLGESQDCEIDINCIEGEDWQILKNSVVHISTTRLLCTGALVNNTNYDGKPFVLTAEHCINKDFYAGSSVFYFGYENSECGLNDGKRNQSISGSYLLSTGGSLDFTLLRLTKRPPREFDVYYSGWDTRDVQHSRTFAIHHPNADAKKISIDFQSTSTASTVPGDLNDYVVSSNYRIKQWDVGTTEGGSSGCPLFNSSKRIIGVLSGGLASCGDSIGYDESTNRAVYSLDGNEDDYFSKVSRAWDSFDESNKQLKHWLDPSNTGLNSIGGLSGFFLDVDKYKTPALSIFPNPAKGEFKVQLPDYAHSEALLEIYNLSGVKIYSEQLHTEEQGWVDPGQLPGGLYIIKVTSTNNIFTGTVLMQ